MPAGDFREQIVQYLTDVHSIEENSIVALRSAAESVLDPQLADVLRHHLEETEEHERLVRTRLDALDASPSAFKDAAQRGVAAFGAAVSAAATDTTGKVVIHAFATEHLEIASYRSLLAVAEHAGDTETAALAERIVGQEQAAAAQLNGLIEQAALVGLTQTTTA